MNTACYLLHAGFPLGIFFDPEDGGEISLQNVALLSTAFIIIVVRTSNPI
jgi:hypothetical protein